MKKLIFTFALFVLVGAGCLAGGGDKDEDVSDDVAQSGWWLAFDLPEGWGMYAEYNDDIADPSYLEVTQELSDVVIQSTTLPIVLNGKKPGEDVVDFVDEDYTYIRAFRFDPSSSVPDDAEDLGNGFYRETSEKGDVRYYLQGENGKYRFTFEQEGQDSSVVEKVVLTAKETAVQ